AVIREVLRLDDAENVDCLPNEDIFTGLAQMGYGKPSTKLTFYKAFFFSQWKFLIHTILQSMSAKQTSWNEFCSAMESAGRMIVELDRDEGIELIGKKEKTKEVKDIVDNAQIKGRQGEK
nr:hypothetical protein [Tanacetum cinerariifolium]